MYRPYRWIVPAVLSALFLMTAHGVYGRVHADFRDLTLPEGEDYWNGADQSGGFISRGIDFANNYNPDWWSWSGFAYSRVDDTETAGWGNQYAVISGTGVGGTGLYAVGFTSGGDAVISLPVESGVHGLYVNNTTYAALDMLQGSGFSKQFGGDSGDDPDWFMLTVTGYEADGFPAGSASIYLADYRFDDNSQNYILKDWTWLSLTNLGEHVKTLRFDLTSSDIGDWGMNTPAYFALGGLITDEHYAPAAGQAGSTAVSMYSESIINGATGWTNYIPGTGVDAYWQVPENALGAPSGTTTNIVGLGDGGEITMIFDPPIQDGPGPDFAVFENAFDDFFLELAFVEVSSDGTNFTRFFNRSLTPDPVHFSGATVWATNVYGLAGKHRVGYGTPFDLGDLEDTPGLDLNNIRYVRLIDIIGDGSAVDSAGHVIYDPHPTEGSAGFDLDAMTVLSNAIPELSLAVIVPATDKRGKSNAVVEIRRKAWTLDEAIDVHLTFGGQAENGIDYEAADTLITLASGETTARIEIRPRPESAGRGDRDVVVQLNPDPSYLNGRRERVRVILHDVNPFDIWQSLQLRADFNALPFDGDAEYWNGSDLSGGFSVNGIHFSNSYNTNWNSWQGFAYSRVNDTNTAGWSNQYAVISGTAHGGTGNYVVAFNSAGTITFSSAVGVLGFYVNNTTYAALDMEHGSGWSKKFGGESGDDPDWFRLTVFGHAPDGTIVGSNTIYLADYRFEDNAQNYIMRDWTWLCLTNLGSNVKTLTHQLASSDVGDWGMNTPAYFALDGLRIDPDSPQAGATADWSGDGIANLMAYTLGRNLNDYNPGAPMDVMAVTNAAGLRGLAIEFNRRRDVPRGWLEAEVCGDLKQSAWLSGAAHVQETVIGGNSRVDRIRATPVSTNAPLYLRLRAGQ